MITKDEIQELLHSTETYRVERTTSTGDMDKFQEAIFAFANDLSGSHIKGYLILRAVMLAVKLAVIMSPVCPPVLSPVVTSWKENVLKFNMTPES